MEQITLTKEECVEQCINKDLKLLDYRVQQILEGVLSESTTYGDARNKLETLKIIAESHFKTEHASVIYKLALKKLDKKSTPLQLKGDEKGGFQMFKILNDIKTSLKNHPWGWKEHLPYLLMLTLSLVALILGVLSAIL